MKLLIVDDEMQIRSGLQEEVDWQAMGFEEVYTAKNGLEAIELCQKHYPEVILTDIRMPGISGLEFSRQALDLYSRVEIIIMSGYSDFEYAKQGIDMGVSAYLLKPIEFEELETTVRKSIENIRSYDQAAMTQEDYEKLTQKETLRRLLTKRKLNPDELNTLKQQLGLNQNSRQVAAKLSVDRPVNPEMNQIGAYLSSLVPETMDYMSLSLFFWDGESLLFLLEVASEEDYNYHLSFIEKSFRKINQFLKVQFNNSVSLALSSVATIDTLIMLFKECDMGLARRLYLGGEQFLCYEDYKDMEYSFVSEVNKSELRDKVDSLETGLIANQIDFLFDRMRSEQVTSFDYVRSLCVDMRNMLIAAIHNRGIEIDMNSGIGQHLSAELPAYVIIDEYKEWLKQLFGTVSDEYRSYGTAKYSKLVVQVIDYIHHHYQSKLYLEDIANHVGRSKNYVSHIFKSEMKMSVVDYSNTVRIEEAKKRLSNTDDMIYQISEDMGFADYKYFSSMFKKMTGLSPQQYRKK